MPFSALHLECKQSLANTEPLTHRIVLSLHYMADRRSDSYDGVPEEAEIGVKVPPKAMNQLSSSADAAKVKRNQKGLNSLGKAVQEVKAEGSGQNCNESGAQPHK